MTEQNRNRRNRPFTPTPRDEAIFRDLYFARILTTEQIAERFWPGANSVYFPAIDRDRTDTFRKGGKRDKRCLQPRVASPGAALRRLQTLREHRLIVSRAHRRPDGSRTQIWMLSRGSFRREAEDLDRYDEAYPGWPKGKVQHFLDANDLYVQLAGELDAILGPYPSWEWRDERRSHAEYKSGGRTRKHLPDAEVRFPGRVFFVERQTPRARKTEEKIREKVMGHEARADYTDERQKARILFACDAGRDLDNARKAALENGLPLFVGTVEEAASHLADEALMLK